jgi:hypothetical protein
MSLHTLPSSIVNLAFQPPRNQTLYATLEPYFPQQCIVPPLVEEQLVMASQRWIYLTVLVQVRRDGPGTVVEVEEEDHTLADVYEESNLAATSVRC